jgi:hypothetical protein
MISPSPHGDVKPMRDMVIVRLPIPPKMVGSIAIPDIYRDMAQYNVMVGRIVAMGPSEHYRPASYG